MSDGKIRELKEYESENNRCQKEGGIKNYVIPAGSEYIKIGKNNKKDVIEDQPEIKHFKMGMIGIVYKIPAVVIGISVISVIVDTLKAQ